MARAKVVNIDGYDESFIIREGKFYGHRQMPDGMVMPNDRSRLPCWLHEPAYGTENRTLLKADDLISYVPCCDGCLKSLLEHKMPREMVVAALKRADRLGFARPVVVEPVELVSEQATITDPAPEPRSLDDFLADLDSLLSE